METPNLDYIKKISDGDSNFEESMLALLKTEFPLELITLKKNFSEGNFIEVSLNIHKIKHKIAMLGMNNCFKLATKIEKNIKKGIIEQYHVLLYDLERINVFLICKEPH